ncbi:histidine phosphatase family protein [Dyella psychrodurans]|uniref:Histidine phosphatase family protein n=1 Tax=Dyella psychrodurans TaxID=1927960 RepID=A0A370X7H1_9GAMM|nr:histidine phosphatase family protein [Dyella psychrodurans]RDS84363.1 histidine phosphatase family protein [Dyella psychrodurans]
MRSVLLIRHGQASFRAADYDRLSELGEEQSRRLGTWLAATSPTPDLVAVGPRQRHLRTAELCLQTAGIDRPLLHLDGLDEVDHEELLARLRPDLAAPDALRTELKQSPDPYRAFQQLFSAAIARWIAGAHDNDYTLTWSQFRDRAMATLKVLADQDAKTIWAFTSGGPIAVLTNAVIEAPVEQTFKLSWPLVNTSLTRLRMGKHAPSLITYNTWPHLERIEDRHLITHR